MAFDFKKEYKEYYCPPNAPGIVIVPAMRYVAVRGAGDPNAEAGDYQRAVNILYALAYTLKMSERGQHRIEGFFEYVVPPLEGFWLRGEGMESGDKSKFRWISVIRLPDFVTKEDFAWAVREAEAKKKLDCSAAEYLTVEEGLCVQMLHLGPYDEEPATIAKMDAFLQENGYVKDFSDHRLHHEIYLSDPRRTSPEKWRTVIRHPIRRA